MIYFSKWKIVAILGIVVLGLIYSLPNFLGKSTRLGWPEVLPNKTVSLGLDLRGGSHLLLEVKVDAVIKERMNALVDAVRVQLRGAKIRYRGLGASSRNVSVVILDINAVERATTLLSKIEKELEVNVSNGRISLSLNKKGLREVRNAAVNQSIEIIRRRIDETGTKEPTIQRQGDERILVQLPGVDDPERVKRLLGKTAKMSFHLLDERGSIEDAIKGRVPAGSRLLKGIEQPEAADVPVRRFLIKRRVAVSGDRLIDAQPSFDQNNEPVVSFRFDSVGGKRFADVTRRNVNKPFAIVLDNRVISAPVIREPILGGSGQISGGFTTQEAKDLALLLRAGALPAPLDILEERTVGPGLGADSIAAGKFASSIGLVLVIIFMIITYGLFGLFAVVALVVNILLILAVLSGLQATLTLPGIAGIVLTIGMAVDANVLVFERIREEVRGGRTPISAIDSGYSRAISTIVDANLTTLIAALILFNFGSGPIKGFAVTLMIGIVTSMFTAIMLTRLMISIWIKRRKPAEVPI